ncbi:hypothetical protein TW95_gp0960 [Pandoravirus inopinatum]|uniref:Uncharacterized protein n=1 Tax=Pandoravirus inopinatum TaxID=1605721 RepID=A0A0B5J2D2_9VIRU|nr:hypothetical protein TW95_gp0960 [Pandoravirus inopinatum]AJF97694.1 hypothetical protein [Pandoravirus inopinatum]
MAASVRILWPLTGTAATDIDTPEHMTVLQCALDDGSKWAPALLPAQRTHDSVGPRVCPCAHAAPMCTPTHTCLPYTARAPSTLDHSARDAKGPTVDGLTLTICRAAGCTKVAHVLISGEGIFCQRHGRIAYAARMCAVALIGNVPFTCAAAVVAGDTDVRVSPEAWAVAGQRAPARS